MVVLPLNKNEYQGYLVGVKVAGYRADTPLIFIFRLSGNNGSLKLQYRNRFISALIYEQFTEGFAA